MINEVGDIDEAMHSAMLVFFVGLGRGLQGKK